MKIVEKTVLTSKTKHNQNTHKSNKYNHSRARTTEKNQIRSVPNTHSCAGLQTRWHKVRSRIRLSPGSYQTFSVPPYLSRCFLSHPSALLLVFGLVLIGFQIHFWELLWDRGNLDELYVSSRSGETPPPLLLLLLLTLFFSCSSNSSCLFFRCFTSLLVSFEAHYSPTKMWSVKTRISDHESKTLKTPRLIRRVTKIQTVTARPRHMRMRSLDPGTTRTGQWEPWESKLEPYKIRFKIWHWEKKIF